MGRKPRKCEFCKTEIEFCPDNCHNIARLKDKYYHSDCLIALATKRVEKAKHAECWDFALEHLDACEKEAKEILNNCGYECEYYRWHYQLNVLETKWKDDYPNNFKSVDYHSGFNPNDIFKIKVEINVSDDIILNINNAKKYLNNIQSILNDNKSDKKCQNAYYQLRHILYDFDSFEHNVKEILNKE